MKEESQMTNSPRLRQPLGNQSFSHLDLYRYLSREAEECFDEGYPRTAGILMAQAQAALAEYRTSIENRS
jgi:hypothetical protein